MFNNEYPHVTGGYDVHTRRPFYNDESDYNTNSPSYYDDLARKQVLIETLSKRIWEYEQRIDKQFSEWDKQMKEKFLAWEKNLQEFDEEVLKLLQKWLLDGTLDHIINETIFSWKVDKKDFDEVAGKVTNRQNANTPLYIPCSTEKYHSVWDQTTHPDVLYIPIGFNGYKYWLSHTPYPYTNDFYENPEIVCSNDGVNWEVPAGLTNPIASISEEDKDKKHHSDSCLVFNSRFGQLECWYRLTDKENKIDRILRKTSQDGVKWSTATTLKTINGLLVSPSVHFNDGLYRMYYVDGDYNIMYEEMDMLTPGEWKNKTEITTALRNNERKQANWHIHVFKERSNLYHLTVSEKTNAIFHFESTDGVNFKNGFELLRPNKNSANFDNKHLYRATLCKVGNLYRLYYGALGNSPGRWRIGLIEGEKITSMTGSNNVQNNGKRYVDRIYGNTGDFDRSTINDLTVSNKADVKPVLKVVDLGKSGYNLTTGDRQNTMYVNGDKIGTAGNIDLGTIFISEMKARNDKFFYLNGEVRMIDDVLTGVAPKIKMTHRGVGGFSLKPNSNDRLEVLDDAETGHANVVVENITIKGDKQSAVLNGALSYDKSTKKLKVYSEGFYNLNTYVNKVPTSATSEGTKGDYAVDSNFLYYCYATNQWSRIANNW